MVCRVAYSIPEAVINIFYSITWSETAIRVLITLKFFNYYCNIVVSTSEIMFILAASFIYLPWFVLIRVLNC